MKEQTSVCSFSEFMQSIAKTFIFRKFMLRFKRLTAVDCTYSQKESLIWPSAATVKIFPFSDANGHSGRAMMFKEC